MEGYISQKDLLNKVGFNYDQLRDWHKAGIIPEPIQDNLGGRQGNPSFYPLEALERIETIKKYPYKSVTYTWGIEGLFHLLFLEGFYFEEIYDIEKSIIEKSLNQYFIKKLRDKYRKEKKKYNIIDDDIESDIRKEVAAEIMSTYVPPKGRKLFPKINDFFMDIFIRQILGEPKTITLEKANKIPLRIFTPPFRIFKSFLSILKKEVINNFRKELAIDFRDAVLYSISNFPEYRKLNSYLKKLTKKNLKSQQILFKIFPFWKKFIWRPDFSFILLVFYITNKLSFKIIKSSVKEVEEEYLDYLLRESKNQNIFLLLLKEKNLTEN